MRVEKPGVYHEQYGVFVFENEAIARAWIVKNGGKYVLFSGETEDSENEKTIDSQRS